MTMLTSKTLQVTALVRMRLQAAIEGLTEGILQDRKAVFEHIDGILRPMIAKRTVTSYRLELTRSVPAVGARVYFKINSKQGEESWIEEALPLPANDPVA